MSNVKNLFAIGVSIGLFFTVAIVYVVWAITSFQWWLLIFAVLWAGFGLLNVRTAKKNFEFVQKEFDLARVQGAIDAYTTMYDTDENAEAEKA